MGRRGKTSRTLTSAELLVLGLVGEMPRHGYELEGEIERRGMREWTQIGFSSIYFVLGRLEREGLVSAQKPAGVKARKTFSVTPAGRRALVAQTLAVLRDHHPTHPPVLLGMIHWPVLGRERALGALEARRVAVCAELARLQGIQVERQPFPDFVEALFDFSTGQLAAEAAWIARTLDYMKTKPWLDQEDERP